MTDTVDLRSVTRFDHSIYINEFTLQAASKNKDIIFNPCYWHKFLIRNVFGLKRNSVLKILMNYVKPCDLIPLHYTEEGNGAFFFARTCGYAIEKICHNKLEIINPSKENQKFKLEIILQYSSTDEAKVDLSKNLIKVLQKRFNKSGTLCLKNFSKDPDLSEYIILSEPRLLAFVLNFAKSLKPQAIKLCNNEISTLNALKMLGKQNIYHLDLRNNLIEDLTELSYLTDFNITELLLEGNPVCDLYDEHNYVEVVLKYCPRVLKLDGLLLKQHGFPSFRRNYLCDIKAYQLVNSFLECYFIAYDFQNLSKLESFYHNEALFTMSVDEQLCSRSPGSENLSLVGTFSNKMCVGRSAILKFFHDLPRLEHDPYSFTVDLISFSEKHAIIVVNGVFRELQLTAEKMQFGFNRNFVLELHGDNYLITNEQLHIFSALPSQKATAFKIKNATSIPVHQNEKEANQLIISFALITNLTKEWSKKFLEECHYNLKDAISLFVDLYSDDNIPLSLFQV